MASLSSSSHSRKDHTSPSNQNGDGHGASKAVGTEENNSMNGSVTVSVPKKSRGAVLGMWTHAEKSKQAIEFNID